MIIQSTVLFVRRFTKKTVLFIYFFKSIDLVFSCNYNDYNGVLSVKYKVDKEGIFF